MNSKTQNTRSARASSRDDPTTIFAKSAAYYSSLFPKTVQELKSMLNN